MSIKRGAFVNVRNNIIRIVARLIDCFLTSKIMLRKIAYHYTPKFNEIILPLNRIWQRSPGIEHPNSACGPASAAILINYFREREWIHLYDENNVTLVNLLYDHIGTTLFGTSARRFCKSVASYLNRHDTNFRWIVQKQPAYGRYLAYCYAIDSGYPVVLRFTFNFSDEAFASHHYCVGIGYKNVNGKRLIATIDPDGGERNNSVHWIDWEKNEPYMKMITFYKREK